MAEKTPLLKPVIRRVIRKNHCLSACLVLVIAASVIASLLPPLVLENAVNRLSSQKAVPLALALAYFCLVVLADVLESMQNAVITIFGQKVTHGIRSALCAKLDRLPAGYFHSHPSGQIVSVFTNDGDAIDVLYSNGIVSMFADALRLVAILAVIFTRSKGLGILILVALPGIFLFTRYCQKSMKKAQLENRRAVAKVSGRVPETVRCLRMIHRFHAENHMEDIYDRDIRESYKAVDRSNLFESIYSPVILITEAAITVILMIFAASGSSWRAFFGMSVGTAVAMISYIGRIFSPLENIGMEIQNIQAAAAAVRHMEEFLGEAEWNPKALPKTDKKDVTFDHVTFGYDPEKPVLRDLSFVISPGENVTFAGRTGAGKSTIFRLLTGLYEPDAGRIRLAGFCPAAIRPEERRKIYGYVEQNFASVPGTVRDQITLFDPEITEDAVRKAVQLSGLTETIRELPHGLDTPMSGTLFSNGQLQLLAIARAVVSDPEILLLDEITAGLDAATEARIIRALRVSSEGRTVISISHRLSEGIGDTHIIEIG